MKLRHEIAAVLLLLLVSAPPRLLGLETLPPGLFHDEAYEGIDAFRILAGARPIFLPENYGREPLYAYVMAALFALGGPTAAMVRATSAIFGLAAIPATYFWGRVYFGPSVGLTAAAVAAASYWLLQESRLGMRPIALPLFVALASAFVWLGARRGRTWAWPLAGLMLGASLYTYLPARLFPLVVVGQAALGLAAARAEGARLWARLSGLLVLLLVAGGLALPLGQYFRENPDDASTRTSVVSIFTSEAGRADPIGALITNLGLNLGMFVWRGDDTLRHNLPYRPVFDLLIAPFFLLGVVVSLRMLVRRGGQRAEHAALWLWLGVMFVPGVLSDSAPHFLRSIGLLPALFALPALGLLAAASWLARVLDDRGVQRGGRVALGALGAFIVGSQVLAWRDYFGELPQQPGLAETFDAPRASLARVAGDPPPGTDLALPTPGWSYATIRFLRPKSFDEPQPSVPARARFGTSANRPNVELLGYELRPASPRPEETARLTLYWRTFREMNASYVESARIVDEYGRVWWQREGVPGFGTLPTDTWVPGEFVADHQQVALLPGTPSGEYVLEIALAQPGGGRRLNVYDSNGRQLGTSLKLPGVRVGG